jgi:acid phosphatase type 7
MKTLQLILCLTSLILINSSAEVMTRGPYLQVGTTESMIIRWRTDTAVSSYLQYGTAVDKLDQVVENSAATTEHEVQITGLKPDTKYYYSVGTKSAVFAGKDADHFFWTHPPVGSAPPIRIWVIGDAGTSSKPNSEQARVRDAYYNFTKDRKTDFWIMLGDNAYNNGTDEQYQKKCFQVYTNMFRQSVCWPTVGNHDVAARKIDPNLKELPYYQSFTMPTKGEAGGFASGTEHYYSFDYANIHFICLDTHEESMESDSPMLTWLKNDLATSKSHWLIAYWHWPPHSKGSNSGNPKVRRNIMPILEEAGVDLVLGGHSHSYERSFFIDGYYEDPDKFDKSKHIKQQGSGRENDGGSYRKSAGPHQGVVCVVAGSSGQVTKKGELNHPAMYSSQFALGSLVLDIDGEKLDAKFITDTGEISDFFTLMKKVAP